ncbi:MAG: hypothetical protein Q7I89_03575 [Syntrophales bacterium]|nr:hypothetical protein [Syntrophales bacterium]
MESNQLLRNLAIAVGAMALSIVGSSMHRLFPEGSGGAIVIFLLAVFLILSGFGVIERALKKTRLKFRSLQWLPPKVGILCGISHSGKDLIPMAWSDISPEEWVNEVQNTAKSFGKRITTKLIYADAPLDSYDAVINPFGGNYPETSFDGFPMYNKILEYIRQGGLFVNVADIPTYWAYNPWLKRSLDRTPAVYGVAGEEVRYFQQVPLMKELALRVNNVESLGPPVWAVQIDNRYISCDNIMSSLLASRAVFVEGNVDSVIVPIKVNGRDMTPLFFCSYGDGRCLISLSFLTDQFKQNRPLKTIISKLIVDDVTK